MSYTWNVKTKVLFGAGKLKELHKEALPGKKALVVISNGKSTRLNGSLSTLEGELKLAGVEYAIFDKIEANPLEPTVQAGVEFGRSQGVGRERVGVCGKTPRKITGLPLSHAERLSELPV